MKKTNIIIPLLLLTSCASNPPMLNRDIASNDNCFELLLDLIKPKINSNEVINVSDDAIVESLLLEKLTKDYGSLSKQPAELQEAYRAFLNGKMSLSVFRKISKEYPSLKGQVSILIFKDVLKSLHVDDNFSSNGKEIIDEAFSQFEKKFHYRVETDDYYILDFPVSDASDADFLGKLGADTVINPLIYSKEVILPTNNFFKLPQAIIREFNQRIKDKVKNVSNVRYGFLQRLQEQRMTYDAFKALAFDLDDKSPKSIVFSVYKDTIKENRVLEPQNYTGIPHKDVEEGLKLIGLEGKFERLPDSADSVAYKISFQSPDELKKITELYELSLMGRISLFKQSI